MHRSYGLQHLRHKRPTFAFTSESGYTHSPFGERSHTRAYTLKQWPSRPQPQCGSVPPAKFLLFRHALYTYISRFSVNPHYQQREKKSGETAAINFIPKPLFIAFFNFLHKWPTFAFTPESGYTTHSVFRERSRTSAYTPKHGAFWVGALLLPSDCFTRFGTHAWSGGKTAYFAAFGSWPGVLPKNAESLRNSDALMRVAVLRRRGPAGLRSLLPVFIQLVLVG